MQTGTASSLPPPSPLHTHAHADTYTYTYTLVQTHARRIKAKRKGRGGEQQHNTHQTRTYIKQQQNQPRRGAGTARNDATNLSSGVPHTCTLTHTYIHEIAGNRVIQENQEECKEKKRWEQGRQQKAGRMMAGEGEGAKWHRRPLGGLTLHCKFTRRAVPVHSQSLHTALATYTCFSPRRDLWRRRSMHHLGSSPCLQQSCPP